VRYHEDERRQAYCDLFDTPGDVNLFVVKPGRRTCWHRHRWQTDEFRVIRGTLLMQRSRGGNDRVAHTLDNPRQRLTVFPGEWHGYENIGTEDAYLLMYLSRNYDPTDEERMSEDEMPWHPQVEKPQPSIGDPANPLFWGTLGG
jgi:quercetin dioxygenase-like cupin family protein